MLLWGVVKLGIRNIYSTGSQCIRNAVLPFNLYQVDVNICDAIIEVLNTELQAVGNAIGHKEIQLIILPDVGSKITRFNPRRSENCATIVATNIDVCHIASS